MAKKSKEKQPPPPPAPPPPPPTPPSASPTSSSSSSGDEDSPPPASSPVKKPAAGSTTAVSQKHPEPSPKLFSGEEEEDEEDSTDEESSEDSGVAAVTANPLPLPTESRNADGRQGLNTSPPSDTESEDGEEDGEEVDSSSESEQQPLPPPPQEAANGEGKQAAAPISGSGSDDDSESSSDSDAVAPPFRISSRNTADPSLKPLSSKPMGSPVQPEVKSPISRKRSTTRPAQVSEKKRKTGDLVGVEAVQEKKEFIRKIWSKADELALLQCILDSKEYPHGTSAPEQAESLLKSVNDSLSSSITQTQMNHKIRRLKQKYNTIIKKVKDVNNPNISNVNDAAAFDLSRKIWGPSKVEPVFPENNLIPEKAKKVKEIIKKSKEKANHLAADYPFLRWHAKNDHADIASVVQSHIPTAEAKQLEGSCKKLKITEIQLHMKKMKLLSSSLKLIEDALEKL